MSPATLLLVAVAILATPITFSDAQRQRILRLGPLPTVPSDPTNRVAGDDDAAALGQQLFFEPRFSRSGSVSCATCHDPRQSFTDGRTLAVGESTGRRHSPTLLNVAYQRWFFWDGRADTLWAQALHPFESETEFDSSRHRVLEIVAKVPELRAAYEQVFGPLPNPEACDEIDVAFANIGKAIAAYERRLVTGPSALDHFVEAMRRGEKSDALSAAAQRGLQLFVGDAQCYLCHGGPMLSDSEFHNIGVPPLGGGRSTDSGRWDGLAAAKINAFSAFGPHSDDPEGDRGRRTRSTVRGQHLWGAFKTPSLRTASVTAPYMHQGQLATLADVLAFYNTLENQVLHDHHQETILVPLELDEEDLADLESLLKAATGTPPPANLLTPQTGHQDP